MNGPGSRGALLLAVLLTAACAAAGTGAPEAAAPIVEPYGAAIVPAVAEPEPATTSLASLGLRGLSGAASAPAAETASSDGGTSAARPGRPASAADGGGQRAAEPTAHDTADPEELERLFATFEPITATHAPATAPEAALELALEPTPAAAAPAIEPAPIMTAAVEPSPPSPPIAPAIIVEPAAPAAPAAPVASEPEAIKLAAASPNVPAPAAAAAPVEKAPESAWYDAQMSAGAPKSPIPPAPPGTRTLEQLTAPCTYAPPERRGRVTLVSCWSR